jgi:Helix-turn-helix domain
VSVESIARALAPRPGLTPTQKLVLIGIANHDGDGGAWPSVATLAGYAQVGPRQVQKVVAALVELGLVTVEVNAGGNDKTPVDRRPNRYTLHLDGVSPGSPRPDERGVAEDVPRGVAEFADGVSPGSPEPSIEPSEEPSNLPPTADAVAREIVDKYWLWVKDRSGHPPAGLAYIAMVNVVRPFVEAGWDVGHIKRALAGMYEAGRSLSRQSLEAKLRGQGARPALRPAVDDDRDSGSGPVAV